ncbi:MAG: nitric oxide synthase oxygenase, partial [Solibacillus sp.]
EHASGREVTGNWVWLVPPLSPATTDLYHEPIANTIKKPNYFYPALTGSKPDWSTNNQWG